MSGEADDNSLGDCGGFFEEVELQANGDDTAALSVAGVVAAEGAETCHTDVAVAGELEAGGEETAVELKGSAELDLEAELCEGGREGLLFQNPAAEAGKGIEQRGDDDAMVVVAVAAQVQGVEVPWRDWADGLDDGIQVQLLHAPLLIGG